MESIQWDQARDSYCYPFDLRQFHRKKEFPEEFFNLQSKGGRDVTIQFENRFRTLARNHCEVYIEVLFWKLFSKRVKDPALDSNSWYNSAIDILKKTSPYAFWTEISDFVDALNHDNIHDVMKNYQRIAGHIRIRNKLIIPLTFTSLAYPEILPMIDTVVISWINGNLKEHNTGRKNTLIAFPIMTPTIENDLPRYIRWVGWCRESAEILNHLSRYNDWRPRDVEMAVFTYQRLGLGKQLEILHRA
ncbi:MULTISPECIES: hypothetical protein [unclassified Methanoregula]|uniref:hypothetical protein n=1 Tax=unclassified Methanoregula TaxID=2649730 RepID=UPI0009C8C932|nr:MULTISPECIES: hypothetical protein [unclassified Methanoregula]OPX62554.1 MAG: hypothetical protein A4E33_02303 [Methanoregula sp. PtaB.Bin085]OPY31653.1 MAG: hypothetical protein A4E34_02846 [Methanoregula sp. PtaU1.Bin006]